MEILKKIPLFAQLNDEQLKKIKALAVERKYPKGKIIFSPLEKAEGFYILRSGKVKVYKTNKGKEQIIKIFSEPALFGEAASFTGGFFPAWAEAMEDTTVLFLPRDEFLRLLKEDPEISISLITVMAQRLMHLTSIIESLSLKDALSKVAFYILQKSEEGKKAVNFQTNLVAMELGLSKETVSRMLSKLKSLGTIEKSGNKVKIKNLKLLKDLAV